MHARQFMEVETPMMQLIPGGASARPFTTHHNALDQDMYLRISPELYLKRLVVGGFERVFEINRNFRNEGLSPRHNPEFTMMELYMAYADYHDLIDLTEALFRQVALEVMGKTTLVYGNELFDFGQPFARLTMREAIVKYAAHITHEDLSSPTLTNGIAEQLGIVIEERVGGMAGSLRKSLMPLRKVTLFSPRSLRTIPLKCRHSPVAVITIRNSPIALSFLLGDGRSATGFPNSMMRKTRLNGSWHRWLRGMPGMMKQCITTAIMSLHSNTAYHRQRDSASVSIGW